MTSTSRLSVHLVSGLIYQIGPAYFCIVTATLILKNSTVSNTFNLYQI